ncbi:hypothetical protein DFH06DRAFT_1480692 [Mycena polygramma]|nr:hypothetical protein DFH06DRAFT_1480692 [Mycena polygramma]
MEKNMTRHGQSMPALFQGSFANARTTSYDAKTKPSGIRVSSAVSAVARHGCATFASVETLGERLLHLLCNTNIFAVLVVLRVASASVSVFAFPIVLRGMSSRESSASWWMVVPSVSPIPRSVTTTQLVAPSTLAPSVPLVAPPASLVSPHFPAPARPVHILVREIVTHVEPRTAAEAVELARWNYKCELARSNLSPHATPPTPQTDVDQDVPPKDNEGRLAWYRKTYRSGLSGYAPVEARVGAGAAYTAGWGMPAALVAPAPAVPAPTPASVVPAPVVPAPAPAVPAAPASTMSEKAKGKQRAVDPATSLDTGASAGRSSTALMDITNLGNGGKTRSSGNGAGMSFRPSGVACAWVLDLLLDNFFTIFFPIFPDLILLLFLISLSICSPAASIGLFPRENTKIILLVSKEERHGVETSQVLFPNCWKTACWPDFSDARCSIRYVSRFSSHSLPTQVLSANPHGAQTLQVLLPKTVCWRDFSDARIRVRLILPSLLRASPRSMLIALTDRTRTSLLVDVSPSFRAPSFPPLVLLPGRGPTFFTLLDIPCFMWTSSFRTPRFPAAARKTSTSPRLAPPLSLLARALASASDGKSRLVLPGLRRDRLYVSRLLAPSRSVPSRCDALTSSAMPRLVILLPRPNRPCPDRLCRAALTRTRLSPRSSSPTRLRRETPAFPSARAPTVSTRSHLLATTRGVLSLLAVAHPPRRPPPRLASPHPNTPPRRFTPSSLRPNDPLRSLADFLAVPQRTPSRPPCPAATAPRTPTVPPSPPPAPFPTRHRSPFDCINSTLDSRSDLYR